MFVLYLDPDVNDSHIIFPTWQSAENKRIELAAAHSEGMSEEEFAEAYDYLIIEEFTAPQ